MTGWKKHRQDELWAQQLLFGVLLQAPGAVWTGAGGTREGGIVGCTGGDEVGRIICCQLKRQHGWWTSLFFKKCFPPWGKGCCGTVTMLLRVGLHQSAPVSAEQRRSLTCEPTANRKPRPLWFHVSGRAIAVRLLCLSLFHSLFLCLLCTHSVKHTSNSHPSFLSTASSKLMKQRISDWKLTWIIALILNKSPTRQEQDFCWPTGTKQHVLLQISRLQYLFSSLSSNFKIWSSCQWRHEKTSVRRNQVSQGFCNCNCLPIEVVAGRTSLKATLTHFSRDYIIWAQEHTRTHAHHLLIISPWPVWAFSTKQSQKRKRGSSNCA